jgi:hypothetical protein
MSSAVDICNLALSRLGDTADVVSIDPPEASAQAVHSARFYPVARDSLLERHDWGFATRVAALAELTTTDPTPWAHTYARPNNAIRLVSVTTPGDDTPQPYTIERDASGSTVIRTDAEDARAMYVERVTDASQFPAIFTDALAWLLASYLAGPIIKGDAGAGMARACLQAFQTTLASAMALDANQRHVEPTHTPGWIGGR